MAMAVPIHYQINYKYIYLKINHLLYNSFYILLKNTLVFYYTLFNFYIKLMNFKKKKKKKNYYIKKK